MHICPSGCAIWVRYIASSSILRFNGDQLWYHLSSSHLFLDYMSAHTTYVCMCMGMHTFKRTYALTYNHLWEKSVHIHVSHAHISLQVGVHLYKHTCMHIRCIPSYTVDIWLSVWPLKCTILLSAFFFYRGQNPDQKVWIVSWPN